MKTTKVSLTITAQIGNIWIKPSIEVEPSNFYGAALSDSSGLPPQESAESCLDNCKQILDNWVHKNYPNAQISGEPTEAEQIIQLDTQGMRARIENATTRKELASLRSGVPQSMMPYFLERQKQIIQSEKTAQ